MIKPDKPDPHQNAPELFPADVWENAGKLVKGSHRSATILPARRPPADSAPDAESNNDHGRLRLAAAGPLRLANEQPSTRDVHRIDSSVVRLELKKPAQRKMPSQAIFREKLPERPAETESASWGRAEHFSLKWVIGISLGIAALVIAALVLLPLINRSNATRPGDKHAFVVLNGDKIPEQAGAYEELITRQDEAVAIYRKFVTAPVVDDILPLLRNPAAVEPLIRSSTRAVLIFKSWDPSKQATWEVYESKAGPYALLQGEMPDYSHFGAYFILDGPHLYLDWKATTGFSTATFDELAVHQGDPSEIRGSISPTDYYTHGLPEAGFRSFLLTAPKGEKVIWCYTRRGSGLDDTLRQILLGGVILEPSRKAQKVTLRLEHGPDGTMPNQWIIAEMLYQDWISQ